MADIIELNSPPDIRPEIGIGAFDEHGNLVASCGALKHLVKKLAEETPHAARSQTPEHETPIGLRADIGVRTISLANQPGGIRCLWLLERKGQEMPSLDWISPDWKFADLLNALVRRSILWKRDAAARSKGAKWTGREEQVLRLLAWGHPLKAIARELGISAKTVEFHRNSAMKKGGLRTRTDLMATAAELHWFETPRRLPRLNSAGH